MTLVVIWNTGDEIRCAADTRLSTGASVLTETGAKILIVPVVFKASDDLDGLNAGRYSLGFSFCGSSMLAQSTHAIASTCSQILHSPEKGAIPSAKTIATIFANVSEYVTKDINSRRAGDEPLWFQGLLFGHCPVEKRFKLFLLMPYMDSSTFVMKAEELTLKMGTAIPIGTGAAEFTRLAQRTNALGKTRDALDVFLEVVEGGQVATVGGHPQIAIATMAGVEILPVLAPVATDPDKLSIQINGFEVSSIEGLDGFSYALRAIGIRTERVAGRRALRNKGIDPDASNIGQGTKNLASMEAALQAAVTNGAALRIDDVCTLDAPRPALGNWYCVVRCQCGRETPIMADPSCGNTPLKLEGDGYLLVNCWACKTKVKANLSSIKSIRWALPT